MSDTPDPKPADAAAAKAKPAGKPGKLPAVLALVNLVATGFLVFKTLTASPAAAAEPAPPPEPPKAAGAIAAVEGPIVTLDPFVVNLRDEGVSRYLKATFELEMADGKASAELEKAKRLVRDELLRYLSGLTVADTLGEEGKRRIGDTVLERLARVVGPDRAKRLFLVEFVVQ